MIIIGFNYDLPTEADFGTGLDEDCARSHFLGKTKDQVDYENIMLLEDLSWMSHKAFKYYLPGFLISSLEDDDGEVASGTLLAISTHVSGPRTDRIIFTEEEKQALHLWFDLVLQNHPNDEIWGFKEIIAKYRKRI